MELFYWEIRVGKGTAEMWGLSGPTEKAAVNDKEVRSSGGALLGCTWTAGRIFCGQNPTGRGWEF